jgi:NAD-dependent DNA ligase
MLVLDNHAAKLFAENINMMVPYYLMASYAYYKEDDPIFSDHFFDDMAKTMLEVWDDIDHFHKHLITVDDLNGGTYLGEYPERIKGGLESLRDMHK